MSSPNASAHAESGPSFQLTNNRMGLWLFIASDAFLFAGLIVTRFYLMPGYRPHLEQGLGLLVTGVLLVSSFFMNRAETAIAYGDRKQFLISTSITLALGVLFLAGVIGVEWQLAPFGPADAVTVDGVTMPVGAIFYMLTGMHAFHVLTGVIFLIVVLRNGFKGVYTAERHWGVEACANYWHFVDVVWIFVYPALYLIGKAAGG